MPRPLVFGNGRLLVQMDRRGRIRDIFWPTVGLLNHVAAHTFRIGILCEGQFFWTDADDWTVEQRYLPGTLVGYTTFRTSRLPLRIESHDFVLEDRDVFLRHMRVVNESAQKLSVQLYFHQDLCIAESDVADTAFLHPSGALIHYKREYAFHFDTKGTSHGPASVAAGEKGFQGLLGTWKDAEDGRLEGRPIAQGAVDSTFQLEVQLDPNESGTVVYRIVCGSSVDQVLVEAEQTPNFPADRVAAAHVAWANRRTPDLDPLPGPLQALFAQSLHLIRSQCDEGGAILAANDSDLLATARAHYSYVWPRDGALVADVLDRCGEHDIPRRFFEFCARLITPDRPFFLQKYGPDGSLGASWHPWVLNGVPDTPLQEDETALTLWAAVRHARTTGDRAWLASRWEPFLAPMADFLASYRDPVTGLPRPSYDLWEERRGVHVFTAATVFASLRAAGQAAADLGDPRAQAWMGAAEGISEATRAHLESEGALLRCLLATPLRPVTPQSPERQRLGWNENESVLRPDATPDASLLLLGRFVDHPTWEPLLLEAETRLERELWVRTPVGGVARYPGDWYYRQSECHPGNPWIITTLWLAQAKIRRARTRADLNEPLRLLEWAADRAETTGVLAEQFHPDTGEPLSVSPLTWSHAEFVGTCLDWVARHQALAHSGQLVNS